MPASRHLLALKASLLLFPKDQPHGMEKRIKPVEGVQNPLGEGETIAGIRTQYTLSHPRLELCVCKKQGQGLRL
jgi:hypothetical protein